MDSPSAEQTTLRWQVRVPIFRNPIILKQLGLAIGVPFGLLALFLACLSSGHLQALYGLGMVAVLLVLTWLLVMVVHGGTYDAEFVLDRDGVTCRTQSGQARKNRVINGLAVVLGLLTGKPAAAGAGLLAASRQNVLLRWSRLRKTRYQPRTHTILLRGGFAEHVALFCTEENYEQVEHMVKRETKGR